MIGVGGQGTGRLREFLRLPDVRIGAICDVNRNHIERAVAVVEKDKGCKPRAVTDFPRLLDQKEINAVAIVTPDHWRAIATVAAFEAGKRRFRGEAAELQRGRGTGHGRCVRESLACHADGNHIHNDYSNCRRVVEIVRSGKLGRIREYMRGTRLRHAT